MSLTKALLVMSTLKDVTETNHIENTLNLYQNSYVFVELTFIHNI